MVFLQGKESRGMFTEHIPLSRSAVTGARGPGVMDHDKAGALFYIRDGGRDASGLYRFLSPLGQASHVVLSLRLSCILLPSWLPQALQRGRLAVPSFLPRKTLYLFIFLNFFSSRKHSIFGFNGRGGKTPTRRSSSVGWEPCRRVLETPTFLEVQF